MIGKPIFKRVKGFDDKCYQWQGLSSNPAAIHILEQNQDKIDWQALSKNSAAGHLLKANQDKIDWWYLSQNTSSEALRIFKTNVNEIFHSRLHANETDEALDILEANQDKIYFHLLGLNTNPRAIKLIEANLDKINWHMLSNNSAAIHLLKANHNKIVWCSLSCNSSYEAMILMEEYLDDIEQQNKLAAIAARNKGDQYNDVILPHVIKVNTMCWSNLSTNPSITPKLLTKLLHYCDDNIEETRFERWFWSLPNTLSFNASPIVIQMLKEYPEKINWRNLAQNKSFDAMKIIEENLDKVTLSDLACNPAATHIIEANLDRLHELHSEQDWFDFNHSSAVIHILFQLDTAAMRNTNQAFAEELAQHVFYPKRLARQAEQCKMSFIDIVDMY